MKFGESLKKERELRGITLDEISHQTKVHTRFLEAIERDDLRGLPAKAFAKGFLRSYARMVGLDEEQVITHFEYCYRAVRPEEYSAPHPKSSSGVGRHRVLFESLFLLIFLLLLIITLYYQGYLNLSWLESLID